MFNSWRNYFVAFCYSKQMFAVSFYSSKRLRWRVQSVYTRTIYFIRKKTLSITYSPCAMEFQVNSFIYRYKRPWLKIKKFRLFAQPSMLLRLNGFCACPWDYLTAWIKWIQQRSLFVHFKRIYSSLELIMDRFCSTRINYIFILSLFSKNVNIRIKFRIRGVIITSIKFTQFFNF